MAKNTEVRKVGRPAAVLTFPRGSFTVSELAELNPTVCTLTVRNKIGEGLTSKFLVKLKDTVKTGAAGRPSFRYVRKAIADAAKARSKAKSAPVTVEAPAPVAVEAPVTVELAAPVMAEAVVA